MIPRADQVLVRQARTLMCSRGEMLADFEAETIRAAHDRVAGLSLPITPAERQVVAAALDAMRAAPAQALAQPSAGEPV